MRRNLILAAFMIQACGAHLFAQNKYDLAEFGTETGRFFTQPLRWDGRDWLTLGGAGAATFAAGHYDEAIRSDAKEHPGVGKTLLVQTGEQWGGFFVTPALGLYLLGRGWLGGSEGAKKMGFEIAQGAIYASVVSEVIKNVVGRGRPRAHRGAGTYKPFTLNNYKYSSFPAGHVDAAFSLATVLSRNADSTFLKVLPYVPAGLTVVSRIYKDQHWASDCVFGMAIGYFTAAWVMDQHEKKPAGSGAAGARIGPYFAGDAAGLRLSLAI